MDETRTAPVQATFVAARYAGEPGVAASDRAAAIWAERAYWRGWHGYSENRTKEVYVRRLKPPLKRWQPTAPAQMPLFADMPWVHI